MRSGQLRFKRFLISGKISCGSLRNCCKPLFPQFAKNLYHKSKGLFCVTISFHSFTGRYLMKNFRLITGIFSLLIALLFWSCDSSSTEAVFSADTEEPVLLSAISPSSQFEGLMDFLDQVADMNPDDIRQLSDEEFREFARPFIEFWGYTRKFGQKALQNISEPLASLNDRSREGSLSNDDHERFASEIRKVLTSSRSQQRDRVDGFEQTVRELVLNWNQNKSQVDLCAVLFNQSGEATLLIPGDNFEAANFFCPEDSFYFITEGVHFRQTVSSPKKGTHWVGAGPNLSILDGYHQTETAFVGRANSSSFQQFTAQQYQLTGIEIVDRRGNSNIEIASVTFRNIGDGVNGQEDGAVKAEGVQGVSIRDSHFENVTSAMRFMNSRGPLHIERNSAINPGRNFFQCDKCFGEGIRVLHNTMEFEERFGTDPLEDYINIFMSEGEPDDWIEVSHNRARGHDGSLSGSFIILADAGGRYQKAIGNIGVNPGQVGIGVAGGDYIKVAGNIMYSEPWFGSNVAYYSMDFEMPCSNHIFPGRAAANPNIANWASASGNQNRSWSTGLCGISHHALRDSIVENSDIGPDIWNLP